MWSFLYILISLSLLSFFLYVQDLEPVEISTAPPVYLNHCGSCWHPSPAFSSSVNTTVPLYPTLLAFLSSLPPFLQLTNILIATLLPTLPHPDCLHHDTKTLRALEHCLQILQKGMGYEENVIRTTKKSDMKDRTSKQWFLFLFVSATSCLRGLDRVWNLLYFCPHRNEKRRQLAGMPTMLCLCSYWRWKAHFFLTPIDALC